MKTRFIWVIAALLLAVLALVAYFVYTDSMEERPTLMYFRADL